MAKNDLKTTFLRFSKGLYREIFDFHWGRFWWPMILYFLFIYYLFFFYFFIYLFLIFFFFYLIVEKSGPSRAWPLASLAARAGPGKNFLRKFLFLATGSVILRLSRQKFLPKGKNFSGRPAGGHNWYVAPLASLADSFYWLVNVSSVWDWAPALRAEVNRFTGSFLVATDLRGRLSETTVLRPVSLFLVFLSKFLAEWLKMPNVRVRWHLGHFWQFLG